jgi:hypothetical protein
MIAQTNDPTGSYALSLASVLPLIILIYFISFMHCWKTSEGPVLELHIDIVSFFHLQFSIPARWGMARDVPSLSTAANLCQQADNT